MQQTILALGALMIILVTALNHQKSVIMIQEASYVREIESAALDLAKLTIEENLIQTEFDQNWLGEVVFPSSPTELTSANTFGPDSGETNKTLFNDVDDFHNFSETRTHSIGSDIFNFNVSYEVSYINTTTGDTTSAQTYAKQLTAHVISTDSIGFRVARASYSKTTIISEDI